ncbi:MAG: TrlF family AAA-like ATPase [Anaerolineales bacterium]
MEEPFTYQPLIEFIQASRARSAVFVRTDLHLHTIDSYDFPSVHSKTGFVKEIPKSEIGLRQTPDEFIKQLLCRAKEHSLRIIAITDHNKSVMAERLSANSDNTLMVLPGIEISAQTNLFPSSQVHILAIFPQGTPTSQIDKVFPAGCGMPEPAKRDANSFTNQPIPQIIDTIKRLGGISIAAHVSSDKGIRTMVHSQNVDWLQKNHLRIYLKDKATRKPLLPDENTLLQRLSDSLHPLDDEVQNKYLAFLEDIKFDAIQIQDIEQAKHYRGDHVAQVNLSPFPCIIASDAHTIVDLGCQCHATYIKLSSFDLDGIKRALKDPEARIRYDTTVPTKKPKKILGISFEGGSFNSQVIGFSDNLSTLIGGRGTGKSAVIEAVRYVLGIPLPPLPQKLIDAIDGRLAFTLRDTEVKLLYQDENDGDIFVVKRRFGEDHPACFRPDGSPLTEISLPSSERIRAEIYGWSEIEELSDSRRKQLALLDRTIPNYDALKISINSSIEALRQNSQELVLHARNISSTLPLISSAAELRAELTNLSKPDLDKAFVEFDSNQKSITTVSSIRDAITRNRSLFLKDAIKRNLADELLLSVSDTPIDMNNYPWFLKIVESIKQIAPAVQKTYDDLIAKYDAIITILENRLKTLEQEKGVIEARLNTIAEASGQPDFKAALARRRDLTERLADIASSETQIDQNFRDFQILIESRRSTLIPRFLSARHSLFLARQAKTKDISQKLRSIPAAGEVEVIMEEAGDITDFKNALGRREGSSRNEGLLKRIDLHWLSRNYPAYYAKKFTPFTFVSLFLGNITEAIDLRISYIRRRQDENEIIEYIPESPIVQEGDLLVEHSSNGDILHTWPVSDFEHIEMPDSDKVWRFLSPFWDGSSIQIYPDPYRLEVLLGLELVEIEDNPRISLYSTPIEFLSPGQRCSALIPLILIEGSTPLIIDQPEDNLDNKLVFDLLVDVLRDLKEQRQIIVATHNPNVPVSGDAEQVVVCESPSRKECVICAQASIDDDDIVRHIKAVMEGGDKAFEMRMRKYGLAQ